MSGSSTSRPVHCAYWPTFLPPIGNVEYATWAFLTSCREADELPNLVTACASTITVFTIDPRSHKLQIVARCNVAENIVALHTLPCKQLKQQKDQLLVGFSGSPRLSIVSFKRNQQKAGYILEASAILDLRNCCSYEDEGATSTQEQDLYCVVSSSHNNKTNNSTGVAIVGGGVALVAFDILRGELADNSSSNKKVFGRYTSEPYILPLRALSEHFSVSAGIQSSATVTAAQQLKTANISSGVLLDAKHTDTSFNVFTAAANKSISTGWGDILDVCFLEGYSTPTIAVLHGYQTWSGRMAGGAIQSQSLSATSKVLKYLAITAVSITTSQKRSVLLWHCTKIPVDTTTIHYCHSHQGGGAILAISPNVISYIDASLGQLKAALAVNGFAHVSCSFDVQPNPSPLPRLAIQLDACRFLALSSFSNNNQQQIQSQMSDSSMIGVIVLRNGRMYALQYHNSVTPTHSSSIMDYGLHHHQQDAAASSYTASTSCFLLALIPLEYKLPPGVKCLTSYQLAYQNFNSEKDYYDVDEETELLNILFERDKVNRQTSANHLESKDKTDGTSKETTADNATKNVHLLEALGIGYIFAGSTLGGNSQLLAYAFKTLPLSYHPLVTLQEPSLEQKELQGFMNSGGNNESSNNYNNTTATTSTGSNARKRKLDSEEHHDDDGNEQQHMDQKNNFLDEATSQQDEQSDYSNPLLEERPQQLSYNNEDANVVSEDELEAEESRLYDGAFYTSTSRGGTYLDEVSIIKPISFTIGGRKSIPSISFFAFHLLDSCCGLGPLGYGCNGPAYTSTTTSVSEAGAASFNINSSHVNLLSQSSALIPFKDNALSILPYGYGECGGIAVIQTGFGVGLTCSSTEICSEVDVMDICGSFVLTDNENKIIVLPQKSGGALFLQQSHDRQGKNNESYLLEQIDLQSMCSDDHDDILWHKCYIRSAVQVGPLNMALIIEEPQQQPRHHCTVVVFDLKSQFSLRSIIKKFSLSSSNGRLISLSAVESEFLVEKNMAVFACVYEKGGTVCTLSVSKESSSTLVEFSEENVNALEDDRIVAMDTFVCHSSVFLQSNQHEEGTLMKDSTEQIDDERVYCDDDDGDDAYIYGDLAAGKNKQKSKRSLTGLASTMMSSDNRDSSDIISDYRDGSSTYIACCRGSGKLEVYDHYNLVVPVWQSLGAGSGCPSFSAIHDESSSSKEACIRCHDIAEMRFFFAGPTDQTREELMRPSLFRPFCLALHTMKGDFHLYSLAVNSNLGGPDFSRVSLAAATRPSSEEGRHRAKLYRRGILSKESSVEIENGKSVAFRYNSLHRFVDISKRSGLFSAVARPFWVLADRGMLLTIPHRMRHLAAGSPKPVKAFCSNVWSRSFLTVHERIGRVGSQRLTVFKGLSTISSPETCFPGGGSCITKIPFGVTVRRIIFLEDITMSSLTFPLFVMIISRDFEASQSHLNDDGLTPEERKKIKAEKEAEKTRRQVEADLAGVDHIEQEWVEEIERDDYFDVKIHLGGAPPILKSTYEVWLVSGNGWRVLDRHELGDCDKALSLLVAPLTEVLDDSKRTIGDDVALNATFVAVGTGYVDQDGEDVSSKGKVILFEVNKTSVSIDDDDTAVIGLTASINVVYEKEMLMGPVTSLSCLTCDNTTRLVVGAGAELTIEQWNGEKLTQVGFFHAHMHVLDVKIFKNFFLLSDAYDSLYFLVWRESDKSLTLLAKDYEPTTIYCAGMLSRGSSIAFVCHDERENVQFFQYAPKDDASRGGNKLVCRSDFHLGTQVACFQSHWCKSSLLCSSATTSSSVTALRQQDPVSRRSDDDQRFGLHFGTIDGSFGGIIPVSEQVYWRLAAVRSVMSNAIDSHCALSTRAWRLYRRSFRRGGCQSIERAKGVLDGELLLQFLDLPLAQQEELASAVGSTVDLITDNLVELECSSTPN